jgi:hypothetical protein
MQKMTPCLWFDGKAEQAVKFYTSIFPNSRVTGTSRCGEAAAKAAGRPKGSMLAHPQANPFMRRRTHSRVSRPKMQSSHQALSQSGVRR